MKMPLTLKHRSNAGIQPVHCHLQFMRPRFKTAPKCTKIEYARRKREVSLAKTTLANTQPALIGRADFKRNVTLIAVPKNTQILIF